MRRPPVIPLAALLLLAASPSLAVQPRGAFLLMRGADTLAIESVQRTEGRVAGTLVFKPVGSRMDYDIALAPDGSVTKMEASYRRAVDGPEAPALKTITLRFVGDSALADLHDGAPKHFATRRGAVPFMNPSMAMVELVALSHRPAVGGRDSAAFFALGGGVTIPIVVTRPVRDTVVVAFGGVSFRLGTDADGGATGGFVPEQGLTIEVTGPLPASVLVAPRTDYSAPAGAGYTAENVLVPTRGGATLAGTLTMPRGAKGPVPCVVTITGSGPEERDEAIPFVAGYRPFRQLADVLARHGIAVLRCDDRGTAESTGNFAAATSADFAHDVEDQLAWLRKHAGIDGSRLAVAGHSEGGMIGPMVAAGDPKLRALVVLAGPSYTGRRILAYQEAYSFERAGLTGAARDSAVRAAAAQLDTVSKSSPWTKYFLDYDPLPTARRVRTPVLILQGETDWQVTPVQAHELEAAFREGGNRDVTLRTFPETDHLFLHDPSGNPAGYTELTENQIRPEILDTLADWLGKHLGK